jgi:hypothetical protein
MTDSQKRTSDYMLVLKPKNFPMAAFKSATFTAR